MRFVPKGKVVERRDQQSQGLTFKEWLRNNWKEKAVNLLALIIFLVASYKILRKLRKNGPQIRSFLEKLLGLKS